MSSEIVERLREDWEMLKDGYHENLSKTWHDHAMENAAKDALEAASHIEALEAENERLSDKIDGLSSDLDDAIETAYHRGAVDWVRMNYPRHFATLSRAKE